MEQTRFSLLQKIRGGSHQAWEELDRFYRPMMSNWLRRYDLQPVDVDDIVQDVMSTVSRKIGEFEHSGRIGAFRSWLKAITVHALRNFLRKNNRHPAGSGGTEFQKMLDQLQDPRSDISRLFDIQHDRYVLKALLEGLTDQFQESSIQAFRLHVIQQVDVRQTAERVGISVHAVYMAKARIMQRLRQQASDWLDDVPLVHHGFHK